MSTSDNPSILQAGVAKSGNYWLYKIIQLALEHANITRNSYIQHHPVHRLAQGWELSHEDQADIDVLDIEESGCFFRIGSIFRMPIDDIDEYISSCSHVWTHSKANCQSHHVFPKFGRIVYIVRDPRDVLLSMANFAFTPYMEKFYPHTFQSVDEYREYNLTSIVANWVLHVGGYLLLMEKFNIHFCFYERFLHQFDNELNSLLDYLDFQLSPDSIQAIRNEASFGTMKAENPNHVRRGKAGKWRNEMPRPEVRHAHRIARPMLEMLNYPSRADYEGEINPHLDASVNANAIQKAMRRAKRYIYLNKVKQALWRAKSQ